MTKRHCNRQFLAQRGYAMLGIIALVGVAATAAVVTTLSATAVRNEQARKTSGALALAKQALVGRAASDDNRPGSLPCPDTNNDGLADADVVTGACTATIGRLPWQTLGLPDVHDANGERLWYALSSPFGDVAGNVVNSNTTGTLNITGTISAQHVVAIVIAPGAPVNGQVRDTNGINSASQYVETYVNATSFSTSADGRTYHEQPILINDQLIVISTADIFSVVQRRVAKEVQSALNAYYTANGYYPTAALSNNSGCLVANYSQYCTSGTGTSGLLPADPSPAAGYTGAAALLAHSTSSTVDASNWFDKNGWRAVVQYQVSPDCVYGSAQTCVGNLTANAASNQKAKVAFNGVPSTDLAQVASTTYSMGVQ
jgi:hypothetical protein